ncbi:ROK family protein [Falsirhodobacter xinxiangensis]|uniref:ROK family protein n=1 Tax=Falsirhodobacter xinxiangensis TaxID=2530049 RepID=UPI0010AAB244
MAYDPFSLVGDGFRRAPRGPVVSDNERMILRRLHAAPGSTRAELSPRFDISQQSVHRIIDQLTERGLIRLGPPRVAGRGQPSPSLLLNGDFAHSWGLSLNTDDVGICLMDFAGVPIAQRQLPIAGLGREAVLDMIVAQMADIGAEHGRGADRCLGVALGISGYWISGTQFNAPLPLHDWSLIELGPLLYARFGLPVWIDNNGNTAAMGEMMLGLGRHFHTFAYVSFNFGLGGGLIVDGELLPGGNRNAGEISGIYTVDEHDRRPALQFLLPRLIAAGVPISTIAELSRDFDPDWPEVSGWVEEVMPAFDRLVAALWAVIDPQAVVLGGQIPRKLAEALIARCQPYRNTRYGIQRPMPKLMVSDLGAEAAALGAAALPLRKCAL